MIHVWRRHLCSPTCRGGVDSGPRRLYPHGAEGLNAKGPAVRLAPSYIYRGTDNCVHNLRHITSC